MNKGKKAIIRTEVYNKVKYNLVWTRMSSAGKIIENFPFSFIVFSFASGLIVLFFSPIRFILPSWLANPLSSATPSDALGIFLSIFFGSFCLGVLLFFANPLIIGDSGLNEGIMNKLRRLSNNDSPAPQEERELNQRFSQADPTEFWTWLRDARLNPFLDILENQRSILTGLLVGSETVLLFINWWFSFIVNLYYPITLYEAIVWLLVLPVLVLVLSWTSNKYVFRQWYRIAWRNVKHNFLSYLQQKQIKK